MEVKPPDDLTVPPLVSSIAAREVAAFCAANYRGTQYNGILGYIVYWISVAHYQFCMRSEHIFGKVSPAPSVKAATILLANVYSTATNPIGGFAVVVQLVAATTSWVSTAANIQIRRQLVILTEMRRYRMGPKEF